MNANHVGFTFCYRGNFYLTLHFGLTDTDQSQFPYTNIGVIY